MIEHIDKRMITLTVHELRKQLKMALDFCVEGGVIEIDRMGQKFLLSSIARNTGIEIGAMPHALTMSQEAKKTLDARGVDSDGVGKISTPIELERNPQREPYVDKFGKLEDMADKPDVLVPIGNTGVVERMDGKKAAKLEKYGLLKGSGLCKHGYDPQFCKFAKLIKGRKVCK